MNNLKHAWGTKEGTPSESMECPVVGLKSDLDDSYINRRRTFCALLDIKGYPVAFIERFKTAGVDP